MINISFCRFSTFPLLIYWRFSKKSLCRLKFVGHAGSTNSTVYYLRNVWRMESNITSTYHPQCSFLVYFRLLKSFLSDHAVRYQNGHLGGFDIQKGLQLNYSLKRFNYALREHETDRMMTENSAIRIVKLHVKYQTYWRQQSFQMSYV